MVRPRPTARSSPSPPPSARPSAATHADRHRPVRDRRQSYRRSRHSGQRLGHERLGEQPARRRYTIEAIYSGDGFYATNTQTQTQTVTPAPLTITANNQTKVYGAALPTLTASYSGFVNGDTSASLTTQPTLSTTATAHSDIGVYAITASGAADSDYSITYVAGSLTVTAAELTITADNQTKAYGAALPTLTASYSGFVDGDTTANLSTRPR